MASIAPTPKLQFIDANGNPLVGGKLYTYAAGTTTPLATYTDSTGNVANTNPIILDTLGEASVWMGSASYKLKLTTSTDVDVWTVDNVGGLATTADLNALIASLASSSGSSMIGFTQSEPGAVTVTVQNKLRSIAKRPSEFGAVGDGVTDDTAAFVDLAAVTGPIDLEGKTYLIQPASTISMNCSSVIGNSATIKLGADMDSSMLSFPNAQKIEQVVFDGDGHYCCDSNYDHFIVSVMSDEVLIENCTFKNVIGKQDRWQYGLGIRWNTRSITRNCVFTNIHTPTTTANSAGFCGGVFIQSDPADANNIVISNHLVENCEFSDIWTTPNTIGQVYHDSDGVRNYFYGTLTTENYTAIYNSTVKVTNCSFVNVLKSATKINFAQCYVQGCRFSVSDALTQPQVYAAFRYQYGAFVSIRDVSINGEKISIGCLVNGAKNYVDNVYFSTTSADASAVFAGNSDDPSIICDISRVYVNSASRLLITNACSTINVRDCQMNSDFTSFLQLVDDVGTINFDNCVLRGKAALYSVSKTVTNLTVRNSTLTNTSTGAVFGNFPTTNLVLDGLTYTSTNGSIITGNSVVNVDIRDSSFNVSGTIATRALNLTTGVASLRMSNVKVTDTSNKDAFLFTEAPITRIDGLESHVTSTNAHIILYEGGSTQCVRNVAYDTTAKFAYVQKCNKISFANIQSEVAGGNMDFWSSAGSPMAAAVLGFTGQLAGTPITTTNYTVTQTGTVSM